MWNNLVTTNIPILNLIVRGFVVYFAVVILLRISGKRQMGQMGATEFVAILLISNSVQNSMNGGDNSLVGGLVLASVLIALSSTISYITYKSRACSKLFEGTPTLLVHNGAVIEKNLAGERLTLSEFKSLLRKQGVHKIDEIKTAILESDGHISIEKREDLTHQS